MAAEWGKKSGLKRVSFREPCKRGLHPFRTIAAAVSIIVSFFLKLPCSVCSDDARISSTIGAQLPFSVPRKGNGTTTRRLWAASLLRCVK